MVALRTPTGQRIRVSEDRVAHWEARGYPRVDQKPAAEAPVEAPVEKAATKKSAAKKSNK